MIINLIQAFQGPLQLVRNEDYMPFLSYIAKPKDIPSLINGQIRPDMDRRVLLKAKEALTNSAQKTEALAAQKLDRWNSSNYQLGELHPVRESSSDLTPEMALDTIKDELCIILDTDAAGFEEIKALALKEYRAPPSGTREGNIAHETALQKIIQDNIKSSQNESLAAEKLQVLLGNPYWPHEKKARFLRKLVSELKSV